MKFHALSHLGWNQFFQSQLNLDELNELQIFRVTAVQRNLVECLGINAQNEQVSLKLKTYFWRDASVEDHPTIGDWILVDKQNLPVRIMQRSSLLKRKSPGNTSVVQLLCANVDVQFIVSSCNQEFSTNRIERYLSLGDQTSIQQVVVLTKQDLCADTSAFTQALRQDYPNLIVEVLNATAAEQVARLNQWIGKGRTAVLMGSSGVGKSTIVNSLIGCEQQHTNSIRQIDSKGRHTTTSRSLHLLSQGGVLLDTPGMRELQLIDTEQGLKSTFSDIAKFSQQCRFSDCQHISEPGCKVQQAIAEGQLSQRRFDNYQKLQQEQKTLNLTLAQKRQKDRDLGRFYKQVAEQSKRFKKGEQ